MNSHIYNLQERTECTRSGPKLRLYIVNYEVDKTASGTCIVKATNAQEVSDIILSNSQFNSVRDKLSIIRIEEIVADGAYADLISEDYLIYHVAGVLPDKSQSDWEETNEESESYIKNKPEIFSGNYEDLVNKPNIPNKTSQLTNDSNYLSEIRNNSVTEDKLSEEVKNKLNSTGGGYEPPKGGIPKQDLSADVQASLGKADTALQEHQSLDAYAKKSDVPNKVSQLTNDSGYLSAPITSENLSTELLDKINAGGGSASEIAFDGQLAGLESTNVQSAIEEVNGKIDMYKQATLDFGTGEDTMTLAIIESGTTITKVKTKNVKNIYLSYGDVIKAEYTGGEVALGDADFLVVNIVRDSESIDAIVGLKFVI